MIVNRYENEKGLKSIFANKILPKWFWNKYQAMKYGCSFKKEYSLYEKLDLPTNIQIETINRCNGECPFCPVNRHIDSRPFVKMSEALYKKIVDELAELNYKGQLALFSNNEPLLDVRLADFTKYARKKLPNAYIYMFTNGTLINSENIRCYSDYMDEIVIDNYNDELILNDNIKQIDHMCKKDKQLDYIVKIHLRKIHEVLNTRGGESPNAKQRWKRKVPCFLPFSQMIIRPDGKVSLCCNDALGKMTLGDVSKDSIQSIWKSDEYIKIRKTILEDIDSIEMCRFCDAYYKM